MNFQKYEILKAIHQNQEIMRKNPRGISVINLHNDLKAGTLKNIYDILYGYIKSGLLKRVSGQGFKSRVILTNKGKKRIKWIRENNL